MKKQEKELAELIAEGRLLRLTDAFGKEVEEDKHFQSLHPKFQETIAKYYFAGYVSGAEDGMIDYEKVQEILKKKKK